MNLLDIMIKKAWWKLETFKFNKMVAKQQNKEFSKKN